MQRRDQETESTMRKRNRDLGKEKKEEAKRERWVRVFRETGGRGGAGGGMEELTFVGPRGVDHVEGGPHM